MPETDPAAAPDLTALTVQLLSAYVANNKLEHGELASLIQSTRTALAAPPPAREPEAAAEPDYKRAVTVRKSLADPDRIVSMIDGKPYRTLTRHLKAHDLTPAEYRARYKLPSDYPTIAPGYSEQRRQVARSLGLGRKAATAAPTPDGDAMPQATSEEATASPAPAAHTSAPAPRGSGRRGATSASSSQRRAKATNAATPEEPTDDGAAKAAPKERKRRTPARAAAAPPADGEAVPGAPPPRLRRGRRGGGERA